MDMASEASEVPSNASLPYVLRGMALERALLAGGEKPNLEWNYAGDVFGNMTDGLTRSPLPHTNPTCAHMGPHCLSPAPVSTARSSLSDPRRAAYTM